MLGYLRRFRGSWPQLGLAAVLLAVGGLLPGVFVGVLKFATDALTRGEPAAPWLAALLGVAGLQAVVGVARARLTRALGVSLVHDLRLAAHRAWHHTPLDALPPVGERLAALSHEADELQYGVSALVTAARNPLAIAALLGSAAWMAPGLALRFTLLAPLLALPAWWGGRRVRRATVAWRDARAAWIQEAQDQHAGLPTTRDLRADPVQIARADAASRAEAAARAALDAWRAVPPALVQVLIAAALVWLLAWGAAEIEAGRATTGSVLGFAVAIGLLQRPLTGLVEVWSLLQRSLVALERIDALLARAPEETAARPPPPGLAFRLRAVGVEGRLAPLDLDVRVGEKVALVGPSGSGKSTLLALLAGHLQAPGVERAPALLVRQDPWVFDRSLAENLRLAAPDAADDALHEALSQVGLALERGIDAPAGERGRQLSGGERQRLCLARAWLAHPDVLLLDEATSELDPESARAIAARLRAWPGTVVFAAHDPWFEAVADRVIALSPPDRTG